MGKPRAKPVVRSKPKPKKCISKDQNDPNYKNLGVENTRKDIYDDVEAFIKNSFNPRMGIKDMSKSEMKRFGFTEDNRHCSHDKHVRPYFRYKKALVKFSNDTGFTGIKVLSIFKHGLINHECTVSQWKKMLNENEFGNKWDRFNTLERLLYESYCERRNDHETLNENDFKKIASDIHLDLMGANSPGDFEPSRSWFRDFLHRHRLTSRKITKYVTGIQKKKLPGRPGVLRDFITRIRSNIETYGADNVWNADESGFKYETVAKRTYEDIGRKVILGYKEHEQNTKSSHTIFPVISAGGKLMPKMMIVLKEKPYEIPTKGEDKATKRRRKPQTAEFGPIVTRNMFHCPNLCIRGQARASTTMKIIGEWFSDVYLPNSGTRSCLMLDAAPTRKKDTLLAAVEKYKAENNDPNKYVEIEQIPPGETGTLQPCDQYLFRSWKHFYKEIHNQWRKTRKDFLAHTRNNVLKIQAFIHNQFSAEGWSSGINKSWNDCCYVKRMAERYDQMTYYCFRLPRKGPQMFCEFKGSCSRKFFIRCFRCGKNLCFEHWLFLDKTKYDIWIHYHHPDNTENEEREGSAATSSPGNDRNISSEEGGDIDIDEDYDAEI